MFDAGFDLEDPEAAAGSFGLLTEFTARARDRGRFDPATDPVELATRFWVIGHGVLMLVLTGVLSVETLSTHVPPMAKALFVAAGDRPRPCERSVVRGWKIPDDPLRSARA